MGRLLTETEQRVDFDARGGRRPFLARDDWFRVDVAVLAVLDERQKRLGRNVDDHPQPGLLVGQAARDREVIG